MEYLTSSSGVKYSFNECNHVHLKPLPYVEPSAGANVKHVFTKIVRRPSSGQPVPLTRSRSFTSYHPNLTKSSINALNLIPAAPRNSFTYGATTIAPTMPNRSQSAIGGSLCVVNSRRRSAVPIYDPINDPHLRDFFERKFKLSDAQKKRVKQRKPKFNECVYKVKVKTGNLNNAGTDANVYLTIYGKRGMVPRRRLFNMYNAIKTDDGYKYKFERNSTNTFKFIGLDLGALSHIVVEHDGFEVNSSWYLQNVIITNMKTNRSWVFDCNDWLSLHYGLGKTKIQLAATRELEKYSHTDYEIVTVTGDTLGAGTDANVFVTLFGPKNKSTPKLKLRNDHHEAFRRGKTDTFKIINTTYVGPIEKILIEHDDSGKSPGWFLERVVITDLKDASVKYFCPCSKWLSRDEGDGQIARELYANESPYDIHRMGQYRVSVFTGDKRNAGTDADVTLIMYGSNGDSGEWKLDDKKNNFERGSKEEFLIECPSIGEIKKIRIGHNNKGVSPGWFLSKVIIDDVGSHRVYEFDANRWLAVDEGDSKTTIFLYPGVGMGEAPETVPYTVFVHTGDHRNAGTSAKVYIELIGGRHGDESSGRIYLKDGLFERGKTDKLHIETNKMLSPLECVLVGHDNSGPGPGWYLSGVDIETPSIGMKQFFPCEKWLAKDEGDGHIERLLKEDTSKRQHRKSQAVWHVWVKTSDLKNAGTDANVSMVVYGDRGKSDEIKLRSKGNNFETGKTDEFNVETDDVGIPFKIRIWHDNKGAAPGWHLDRVELENMDTKEHYFFHCNRWLARDEDDHEIVRELPAEGDSVRKPLPLVNYLVEVHTGEKRGAGTNADVFLNLFGDLGDTGERELRKSQTHKNKFERGQVDVFKLEAVTLKKLRKIRIGHNGKGVGDGWYLNKVVVKQEGNPKYDQVFECNRWLATDEDDGAIVRELLAEGVGSQLLDTTSYHISVKTGDVRNAGTDADVTIKMFGEKGDSGNINLKNSENKGNKFERGRVDLFKIEAEDIGRIDRIKIGHNGKGIGAGWFLDNVQIDVPAKGKRYMFAAHRWLDENEDDRRTSVELFPTEVKKVKKMIPYVIKVKTGSKSGAGTDANVFIQMYGTEGKSEEYMLRNNSDNFERGKVDEFKIEADDVGPIYKVRIGHDDKGRSSGWFLENLHIQRHALKGSKRLKKSSRHSSTVSLDEPEIEDYYFQVNRWFATDEDDRQIVRELMPTDQDGRPLIRLDEVPYEVKVYTGDVLGAGTDANVFLTVYGESDDSGERELRKSDHRNKFEQNQVDTFIVKAIDLGNLSKIKIRHDDSGIGAAWYLEKVEIRNPNNDQVYLFNCQRWLAKNKDDGKIALELPAIDPAYFKKVSFRAGAKNLKEQLALETEAITNTYNISVVTSDKRGAGTDANVFIQLFGNKQDSGKIFLETSKTHKNKFERGQTDVFEVKEADVGDIRKIRIGHDGKGPGAGWHLKEVVIDAPKLGHRWRFPCNRWLDKNEEDGKIVRDLEPSDMSTEQYQPFVPYEIVVYTSDLRNADTTANPFIVLYGKDTRTQQVNLCKNKTERKDKFKRNAVDRFILELEDVGNKIEKIRLGHDNIGLFPGWHVDKVEIRRLKESGKGSKIHVFPCNRWLARDEGDGSIDCSLIVSKIIDESLVNGELRAKEKEVRNHLEFVDYTIEVFTGDVPRAGTNANVYLTLYGEFGDSGEQKLLKSETHTDKFERNHMDRFRIQTADLGPLYKISIRHDDAGLSPDWFLDRVEVSDTHGGKYTFICERWLSRSKEDKKLQRELFEKNYKGPRSNSQSQILKSNIGGSLNQSKSSLNKQHPFGSGDETEYKITIRTGNEKHGGTDAQVFIRLFGFNKRDKTDRLMLQLARKKRFEPGSSEIFQIYAPNIGDLAQIEIGHDGIGMDAAWYLKDIEINEPLRGKSYFITCNSWLSTEHTDGLTIRRFNVDEANTKITSFRGMIPHTITFYTGDVPKAGTDSNVKIKLFGAKGSSDDIEIEQMENRFTRGAVDTVKVDLDDIGPLKKVRVSHDAKGSRKEWYLDAVEVTNEKTGKKYIFECREWLSNQRKDAKGLSIDIPVLIKGREAFSTTDYRISVKTSDISGAGTDANVFLTLFGENGDSGELELKKSETNFDKFERNRTDVFMFKDILSLGELAKCRIRHDNSGTIIGNANWHLESVVVEDLTKGKKYTFMCNKWLSKSKDDKQIVRELVPSTEDGGHFDAGDMIGEKTNYEITIITADERDSGTKQNVMLVLIGEGNRQSKPLLLENTPEVQIFRRGQSDQFTFKTKSVGQLKKVALGHMERADRPAKSREERAAQWLCTEVIVKDTSTNITYYFPINDGFKLNQEPKAYRCENKKEGLVTKTRKLKNVDYEVTVFTGSSGVDSNVFITLFGENGDTGQRPLKRGLSKNSTEKFLVECLELGKLKKIKVGHDSTGFRKSWLLDKVEVKDPSTGEMTVFPCNRWFGRDKEDGELERELFPEERSPTPTSGRRSPFGSSRGDLRGSGFDLNNRFDSRDRERDNYDMRRSRESLRSQPSRLSNNRYGGY